MDKRKIEKIFRWRKTLINNWDKITGAIKSSKKADLSSQGQLDLFSVGLEDVSTPLKLNKDNGHIDIMENVKNEIEVLGVPVLFNPIDDYVIHKELFCTHEVHDLLRFTEAYKGIIVLDRITSILYKSSQKSGNKYCKLFISELGEENYLYLWGKNFSKYIPQIFIDNIYLIEVEYITPTPKFDMTAIAVTHIKNVKDVDVKSEIERLIFNSKTTEINEKWQLKNRKAVFSDVKIGNPYRIIEGCCYADFVKKEDNFGRCFGGFHDSYETGNNYKMLSDQEIIRLFDN